VFSRSGTASRVGPFYHRAVPLDNTTAPLDVSAQVVAQVSPPSGQGPYPTTTALRTGSLAKAVDTSFAYDAAGNLLQDASRTYTWDRLGRLVSVERSAAGPGSSMVVTDNQRYRYGPDGMR